MNHLSQTTASDTKSGQPFIEKQIAEQWITKKELGIRLRFSESYINKLMKKGWIGYQKIGRSVRFIFSDVVADLKRRNTT